MEIDLTEMSEAFRTGGDSTREYQDSVANSGLADIGAVIWRNAMNAPYTLVGSENRAGVISWLKEFGAWDDLEDWPNDELNALMIQFAVAALQDLEKENWNWAEYLEKAEQGEYSEYIFEKDGRLFFSLDY